MEVIGDLAAARHVAVVVPGVNTRLADFDRGLGGVARRAPAIQARALYTAKCAATTAPVAVVAWLGYLPPPGVGPGAATAGHARAGARDLAAFVPAYLAGRQVTLVGHSYGALVVGLAAPRLPQVRDVVLLGAPGAGHDRAADLGGARVWAALSADDWVRRIPQLRLGPLGHGRRPTAPRFGATGPPTDGVSGHDSYLAAGGATLAAVAAVAAGTAAVGTAAAGTAAAGTAAAGTAAAGTAAAGTAAAGHRPRRAGRAPRAVRL